MDWEEEAPRFWELTGFDRHRDFADHVIEGFGLPDMNGDGRHDHRDVLVLTESVLLAYAGDGDNSHTHTIHTLSVRKNGDVDVVIQDQETGAVAEATFDRSGGTVDVFIFR